MATAHRSADIGESLGSEADNDSCCRHPWLRRRCSVGRSGSTRRRRNPGTAAPRWRATKPMFNSTGSSVLPSLSSTMATPPSAMARWTTRTPPAGWASVFTSASVPALSSAPTWKAEYDGYATDYVDQLNRGGWDGQGALLRHAEGYLSSTAIRRPVDRPGQHGLGRTRPRTTSPAPTVVGYSAVSDLAGGQLFAYSATTRDCRRSLSPMPSATSTASIASFASATTPRPSPA